MKTSNEEIQTELLLLHSQAEYIKRNKIAIQNENDLEGQHPCSRNHILI